MHPRNHYIHNNIDKSSVSHFNLMNGLNPNPVIPVHEQNLSPRSPLSTVSIPSPSSPIADQHNLQQNHPNHYTSELPVQFSGSLASGTVTATTEQYTHFSDIMNHESNYEPNTINTNQCQFIGNSETRMLLNNQITQLKIRVEGIPETGAKSRVETQSKLCLKLLSENNLKVSNWSYLRIHESMLARSKLRKSQQQKLLDGSAAAMVSDESKVLDLEATVICESDETKRIKMCQGCVRRERKRAERKKDVQPSSHDLSMNPRSDAIDEAFERDRQRILLFNCEPLVSFSTGDAILPTRITCYCRHHNERIGFRIRFTMRNHLGIVVATGDSPPIMITDDHKSSKTRVPNRKRRRGEYELETEDSALATPASSRPGSCCGSTPDEYTSIETPFSSHYDTGLEYFSRSRTPSGNSYSSASVLHHFNSPLLTPSEDDVISTNAQLHNSSGSWKDTVNPYRNVQYPMLEISTMRQNRMATTDFPYPMVAHNAKSDASSPPIRRHNIDTATSLTVHQLQQQIVSPQFQQVPVTSPVTSPQSRPQMAVSLERIVPSQGPTHGGIEVTIVGNGFHQGLTLMFGDQPATTICWSPSSMVCVLPPSENTGPVVVSFKEHLMSNNEVPLFSYYNSGNKELLELSLQAVGLNNSGHFEEAKNTAIRLLQDSHNQNSISLQLHRDVDSQKGDSNISNGVEYEVIKMLSQIEDITALELTNIGGQNILHLSAHLDYYSLVSYILARHPGLVNTQDCNGLSPLHFGCLSNATQVIQVLLNSGANISLQSNFGTPVNLVSRCIQPYQCSVENDLFNPVFSCITETLHGTNSSAWRLPRQFINAATHYQQRKDMAHISDIDIYPENPFLVHNQNIPLLYSM